VGQEEPNPIHVADVERMLKAFLLTSQPKVVLAGEVSPTKIDVLQTSSRVSPTTPDGQVFRGSETADLNRASGAKRLAENSYEDAPSKRPASEGVQRPRNGRTIATPVHVSSSGVQPTETTSHRHPRAAHGKKHHVLYIGEAEDQALYARVNFNDDIYHISMPQLDLYDCTPSALQTSTSKYHKASKKWDLADMREFRSLVLEHKVWDIQQMPDGRRALSPKWIHLEKPDGTLKSRMCARGFNMVQGVDYDETFSPVAKIATYRIFLTLVASYSLHTVALDVKTAFLNADMEHEVWMMPSENLEHMYEKLMAASDITPEERKMLRKHMTALNKGGMLLLLKALYGTKNAGRLWYLDIDGFLKDERFEANKADHCFYTLVINDTDYVLLLLYVDDIIIAATTAALCAKYSAIINQKYRCSILGELRQYLNIQIEHDRDGKQIFLSQQQYIEAMIADFAEWVPRNNSITTPMLENLNLIATEEETLNAKQSQWVFTFPYRKLVGTVLYLNVCTRPAISYAISMLAQFNNRPTFKSCTALVRLAQYVYNTREDRLVLGGGADRPTITAYSDSDWGGCRDTRMSRSGHIVYMGNGPVIWYSKKQTNTACSSCEAEYMSMSPCIQNINYARRIVNCAQIPHVKYRRSSGLWTDNTAAISVAAEPVLHQRTKHIGIKYQYANENIENGTVHNAWIASVLNWSDMMTKAQGRNLFGEQYPYVMGGKPIPLVPNSQRTTEEDSLPCPHCSKSRQWREEPQL
jgi:hypothetical protein